MSRRQEVRTEVRDDRGRARARGVEDDALTVEVVDLIGRVIARYHEEYEHAASALGLTGAQAKLLDLIVKEPLPMRHVANVLRCEPSNVTGVVDRLEARGLVERRPSPGDRRIKLAAPTQRGVQVAAELSASLSFARQPLAALSFEERTTLRDLLKRLAVPSEGRRGERPEDPA